jgi:hypothetical protein
MTLTSVDTDYDSLTITLIADFDNPIDQVGELWRIRASSRDGGARRAIRRRSRSTPSLRAVR